EVDVDCISNGEEVYIGGVMEHIEQAGVHSGDSACSLPPYSLSDEVVQEIQRQTTLMAKALNVTGLMNVQFAIQDGEVFVLEVNPRASRTVSFDSTATGLQLDKQAAQVMAGKPMSELKLNNMTRKGFYSVKEGDVPLANIPEIDTIF